MTLYLCHYMVIDRGLDRETTVGALVAKVDDVAGFHVCIECGGDGDWSKFHPEPETVPGLKCVECKGTGQTWVSI